MHKSPRFFGIHVGMTASEVYDKWEELGLIEKHYGEKQYFWWDITDYGKSLGGRKSSQGTPTFDYDDIKDLF
ncbi:MAG: hypothetical protein IJR95_08795 [Lachnospiraceae bacterium]|nr:hypothetical protein [Lachnospiraceae bacterium]